MDDEKYLRELGTKIGEINGKLNQMLDIIPVITKLVERVSKAESSTKNAHLRLNEVKCELKNEMEEIDERSEKRAENLKQEVAVTERRIYWTAGVIVSAIQVVAALGAFIWSKVQ